MAVIKEIEKAIATGAIFVQNFAYFFCQNTDDRLGNAISVLRGLVFMLVERALTSCARRVSGWRQWVVQRFQRFSYSMEVVARHHLRWELEKGLFID